MTDLELQKLEDDIFYNTTLKVLHDYNKKNLESAKNNISLKQDEEQKLLKKYDIHLLDFKGSVVNEFKEKYKGGIYYGSIRYYERRNPI